MHWKIKPTPVPVVQTSIIVRLLVLVYEFQMATCSKTQQMKTSIDLKMISAENIFNPELEKLAFGR